jgi:type II secretory pathway component PulM
MKSILHQYRLPDPPPELRDQILDAIRRQRSANQQSWIDRVWLNRKLRISWAAAVVVLALFLAFWNPAEQNLAEFETKETTDPVLNQWLDEAGLTATLARNQVGNLEKEEL